MKKIISVLTLGLFTPLVALAYDAPVVEIIKKSTPLRTIIGNSIDWLVGLVGVAAVLFLIWGGFLYITSAGNKERAESAKKTITYAAGGLIIVILARIIVTLIIDVAGTVT